MDEIICPDCGRPNLSEAEKCWYCQVPLVKSDADASRSNEALFLDSEKSAAESTAGKIPLKDDSSEDLPDWLKRIRELKKADQPAEEIDQWQQEKLFAGHVEDQDKTSDRPEYLRRISRSHNEPDPKPMIPEGQPMLEETPAEEELEDQDESKNIETADPDDELPDGFTPLKTEND
jgi:hypothetical protein